MKTFSKISLSLAQALILAVLLVPSIGYAANTPVEAVDPVPQGTTPAATPQPAQTPAAGTPTNQPAQTQAAPAATPAAGTPVSTTTATTPASAQAPAANADSSSAPNAFVSLTQLPGLSNTIDSATLPVFFNYLYKLCIGIAAVIAVLQIMRAGVMIMTSAGSVSSNEAAKSLIQNSILGLVLVLSPYIVFSIINPDILNLNLNVTGLKSNFQTINNPDGAAQIAQVTQSVDSAISSCNIELTDTQRKCISDGTVTVTAKFDACIANNAGGGHEDCIASGYASSKAIVHSCYPDVTAAQETCVVGKLTKTYDMGAALTTAGQGNSCNIYSAIKIARGRDGDPSTASCDAGWTKAPNTCCSLTLRDQICCAQVGKTQYLLAITYSHTEKKGEASCLQAPTPQYFNDEAACNEQLTFDKTNLLTPGSASEDGGSNTNLKVLKACVAVTSATYAIPKSELTPPVCK